MTAVAVAAGDVEEVRAQLRRRRLKGQRSIHFTKESEEVRRVVIELIAKMPIEVKLYHVNARPKDGRPRCLRALAESVRVSACRRLVLDQSDSVLRSDRKILQEVFGPECGGTYDHLRDHEEPLLWIADAISWCWNKGGSWRNRLSGIEVEVIELGAL